jgi:hypothetical protein
LVRNQILDRNQTCGIGYCSQDTLVEQQDQVETEKPGCDTSWLCDLLKVASEAEVDACSHHLVVAVK